MIFILVSDIINMIERNDFIFAHYNNACPLNPDSKELIKINSKERIIAKSLADQIDLTNHSR